MQAMPAILPVAYLPPINYFAAMLAHNELKWDVCEFYHKQFYYNRCVIYGPNGEQKLTIPIHKRYEKTPLKDIIISYETAWQKIHWRSFEAAYRRSPYFEYYEQEFYPLYFDYQPQLLVEWNMKLLETVCRLMGIEIKPAFTTEYIKTYTDASDYRNLVSPLKMVSTRAVKYYQVFEEKHGFLPDLSIIDLLFCEGPHAKSAISG